VTYGAIVPQKNLDMLRNVAEYAAAQWRACEAERPRDAVNDAKCVLLRVERDLADTAFRRAYGLRFPAAGGIL
jgi:hypothetical protein